MPRPRIAVLGASLEASTYSPALTRVGDFVRRDGEALPSLTGLVAGHPRLGPGSRRVLTSNLAALDAAGGRYARTLSRWVRLGHQGEERLS